MPADDRSLPIVADCNGCGACCFHMGYPPFIRPLAGLHAAEIDASVKLQVEITKDPQRRIELENGIAGEKWWIELPDELKTELDEFIANYQPKQYGNDVSSFDDPCFWFDMETRQCKHHQYRPNVCRDFETGSKQCYEWRSYYREKIRFNV